MHLFKLQENLFLKKILEFLLSKIGSISFINKYSFFYRILLMKIFLKTNFFSFVLIFFLSLFNLLLDLFK